MITQTAQLAAVGLEMGLAMAIGVLGGRYLDDKLGTEPVLFWIGFALGIGAATKALVMAARKARKTLDSDGSSSDNKD